MKELQVEKKRKSDEGEEDVLRLKKRWKAAEKGDPDIGFVIEQLSLREPGGKISTVAFLCASRLLLHVIGYSPFLSLSLVIRSYFPSNRRITASSISLFSD